MHLTKMALMWPCHDFISLVCFRKERRCSVIAVLQNPNTLVFSWIMKTVKCLQKNSIIWYLKNKIFKFYVAKYFQLRAKTQVFSNKESGLLGGSRVRPYILRKYQGFFLTIMIFFWLFIWWTKYWRKSFTVKSQASKKQRMQSMVDKSCIFYSI